MTVWLASNNLHKKNELSAILHGVDIQLPQEAGIPFDPEETGSTFAENAFIKAKALYDLVREPVIADDSGICVDALGGRPGIYSSRYGSQNGKKLDSMDRNTLLLQEMHDVPNRKAHFVCAMIALLTHDRYYLVQETLEGELLYEPRGENGFGYDPILYLPEYECTVAELPDIEKNKVSHRAKAGRLLNRLLEV
jgi:XTP/dITP diphosphohydrolase